MAERLNISRVLRAHGLRPKKSWSQNFLVDTDVLRSIADAAVLPGRDVPVVELGAGVGALTSLLSLQSPQVVAVERDRELARLLRAEFGLTPNVEVLEANAATLDWKELAQRLGQPPVVVGNLPYHMATPILFHLIENGSRLSRWVLMFQREMARRIASPPGSREFGVLSVLVQMQVEAKIILDVGPKAFYPAPKVHSQVVCFDPLPSLRVPVKSWATFQLVVRAAFSQRRKTILNCLSAGFSGQLDKSELLARLNRAGIEGQQRAEQLSLEKFAALSGQFE